MEKYDLDYLERISGGDKAFVVDMINTFITRTPDTLSQILDFCTNNDMQKLYRTVHQFIPTLSYVGLLHTQKELKLIEQFAKNPQENNEDILEKINIITEVCNVNITNLKTDFNLNSN